MTTIRVAKRTRFTAVDRRTIRDASLSFRARGILVWLLDKPDDWSTRSDAIAAEGTEGRDAVRAALTELVEHGYMLRRKWQDEKGQWEHEVTVYERPQCPVEPQTDSQAPENQSSVLPSSDSQALQEATDTNDGEEPPTPDASQEEIERTEADLEAGARALQAMRARHGFVKRESA